MQKTPVENSGKQPNNYLASDLQDSEKDRLSLEEKPVVLDLPDVEDIPGQENIKPPNPGEYADTTISSDDEEGVGLFEEDDDALSNVSETEKKSAKGQYGNPPDEDEQNVGNLSLDRSDEDGDPVNEGNLLTDRFGEDLNLPESEEITDED